MDWQTWKPWYERIAADFGYDVERDRKAAYVLSNLLKGKDVISEKSLADLFRGREAVVFGPADTDFSAGEGEGCKVGKSPVNIAAGTGLTAMLDNGIRPEIIVTDLDGDTESLIKLNREGIIAVIHAHGDNVEKLRVIVPKLEGPIFGTTQVEDIGHVRNFGGFTDGDRAVFLALYFGARKVMLKGFDFDSPVEKNGADISVKKRKLEYAKELIAFASGLYEIRIIEG